MWSKLNVLTRYLNKPGLQEEVGIILKLSAKLKVLAHITGASGSGKTTLLEEIAEKYSQVVTKDLDKIDEDAEKALGLGEIKKDDWTDQNFDDHQAMRQKFLDKFITDNTGSAIILGGYHSESKGRYPVTIPTDNTFMLDTSAKESARRAYLRSQKEDPKYRRTEEELPLDIQEAEQDISAFLDMGYQPKSYEWILSWIGNQL